MATKKSFFVKLTRFVGYIALDIHWSYNTKPVGKLFTWGRRPQTAAGGPPTAPTAEKSTQKWYYKTIYLFLLYKIKNLLKILYKIEMSGLCIKKMIIMAKKILNKANF